MEHISITRMLTAMRPSLPRIESGSPACQHSALTTRRNPPLVSSSTKSKRPIYKAHDGGMGLVGGLGVGVYLNVIYVASIRSVLSPLLFKHQ
jgi:hypothetical protein